MSKFGKILWQDLTVENAEEVKTFYSKVVGWESSDVNQGDYNDFNMHPQAGSEEVVAGICHKRGEIKNFPSQWLMYITIENLDDSISKSKALGGKIIEGPKKMGKSSYAIVQDPAGAYFVLFEE
jgi:uncharacterized protein